MRTATITASALLSMVTAVLSQTPPPAQQQLVLRSSTNSVAVHVLVRNSIGPVRNLTAGDFVVTDSGVRQEIATMTVEALPLDVTVVVDRLEQSEFSPSGRHPQIQDIVEVLRPEDRIRVITVGTDIEEVARFAPPSPAAALASPRVKSEQPALYDGVASALLRITPPGRQHLVMVLSEGWDSYSFMTAAALEDIAERTDAQMHVVVSEGRRGKWRTLGRAPNQLRIDDGLGALVELAEKTGGGQLTFNRLTRSVTSAVRRLVEDVRSGYVLYYSPTGVSDRGWHPIEVKVSRPDVLEIRARPGYAN